jgi:thiol:disulfide interchange protein DsbG
MYLRQPLQKVGLIITLLVLTASLAQAAPSSSTTPDPSSSPVLSGMMKAGAKLYYLGTRSGLDGWLILKDGQIQVAYVTSDKQGILIGAMFGANGEGVTTDQIKMLADGNKEVAAVLMGAVQEQQAMNQTGAAPAATPSAASTPVSSIVPTVPLSPGEHLLQDFTAAQGVVLGSGAPRLYMVMDPNCPHCQAAWRVLRDAVFKNAISLKMIPIAPPGSDSERAAGQLLHIADPLNAWDKYVGPDKGQGDKTQLAGVPDPSLITALHNNRTLIDGWHIDQTPYFAYRGKDGKVKIVVGEPDKVSSILSDLVP